MSIARNSPCSCGSGKKYKKCCYSKTNISPASKYPIPDPHYFELKGKNAEKVLEKLAHHTFISDWCFLNPKLPNGKELCDLLIVFDDKLIIWQIKDLKINKDGKFSKSEVDKNLRQLLGAKRQLFDLKTPINFENSRRKTEVFDSTKIRETYLISGIFGGEEDFYSPFEEIKGSKIHIFTKKFSEIILNELDTISDFCKYLKDKEKLMSIDSFRSVIVSGGEEELLAFYILQGGFEDYQDKPGGLFLDDGIWDHLMKDKRYLAKKEADKISYGWDEIINRTHEGSIDYEIVAKELAIPTRFERRCLSQAFMDGHIQAYKDNIHPIFRRKYVTDKTTYCFLFIDKDIPRSVRINMLETMCGIARGQHPQNKKIIGIATENQFFSNCSYDYIVYHKDNWTTEDEIWMKETQEKTGIFLNPKMGYHNENEYPKL